MVEWETSEALHNDRLISEAIGAASGGSSGAREATPVTTLVASHRYTLRHAADPHCRHQEFAAEGSVATELMKGGVS
jgi:hypothetical protein